MTTLHRFERPLFLIVFAAILWIGQYETRSQPHVFQGDDVRYMRYAVSLHEHGVFGLSGRDTEKTPAPGNANAPLYPMIMAGAMALDSAFAESAICIVQNEGGDRCPQNFQTLYIVQTGLALLCLFLIFLTAQRLTQNTFAGWAAAILAVLSGILTEFSGAFMTEILILPGFCALILFCLLLYESGHLRWVVSAALTLAFLTLVRPSYLYLFYGFAAFFMIAAAVKRDKSSALRFCVLIVAFMAAVSPWALRNKAAFDSYTLTSGDYGEKILIERINYNQMSWPEIGAAMIYWMPDFGDSLARDIFGEDLTARLGWGEGSYYAQSYHDRLADLSDELGGRDKIMSHLIMEDVLSLKHVAVSIPLAVRGVFIAKYWGLAGFIAFLVLLIQTLRRNDYRLLIISLPLFFMVAFHAGVSVSIPRYNLPLISLYTLSMAHFITIWGGRIAAKIRTQ